ncbi:biliverdin-producing heme oxygenase [Ekhidna sp.]
MSEIPLYLTNLRNATRKAHERLELLTESDLFFEQPSKAYYSKLLQTHYYHHLTIAKHTTAIANDGNKILDWPDCIRLDALRKDLSQLGVEVSDSIDISTTKPAAYVVGLCYVSEGSCMGNQMMLQALKKHEEFNSWQASYFFESCKKDFGIRWKSFLEAMHPYGEHDYDKLESGSLHGFELFEKIWLDQSI